MKRTSDSKLGSPKCSVLPSDFRELTYHAVFALWIATTIVIQAASYVPGLVPDDAMFWRVVLGGSAIAVVLGALLLGPRLSDKAFHRAVSVSVVLSFAVNAVIIQITPATLAILTNTLVTVMFVGYFLPRGEVFAMTAIGTAVALSATFLDPPGSAPHLSAWLTVYIPTMWVIALALNLQRASIEAALDRLAHKAYTDPLTGLANLRALNRRASEVFNSDSGVANDRFAVALVDIDNFKSANTRYGHLGGDRALRAVADNLLLALPDDSIIARVGGDEFAAIVPIATVEELPDIARNLRAAVLSANAQLQMPGVEIDASVGTAVYPTDGAVLGSLMTVADKSMYKEKSTHVCEALSVVRAVEDPDESAEWTDDEQAVDQSSQQSGVLERSFGSISVYAGLAAVGWLYGCVVLALSLAMPGADHTHLLLASLALIAAIFLSGVLLVTLPPPHGKTHYAYEAMTLAAIALMMGLTGGSDSPATALVYLLIVFQSWFWEYRKLAWRLIGPVAVVLSPLAYENVLGAATPQLIGVTLYAGVVISLILAVSLQANQTYLHRIRKRAHRLAATDPLTHIANRRAFNTFVEEQLVLTKSDGDREFAIVMIDLDNFKAVNTVHGHNAGDLLLCEVAEALLAVAREEECIARIGGDEFAAVLPGAGIEGAAASAERFVSAVVACTAIKDNSVLARVTASAGYAIYPHHGSSLDALVRNADSALMAVKAEDKGNIRAGEATAIG